MAYWQVTVLSSCDHYLQRLWTLLCHSIVSHSNISSFQSAVISPAYPSSQTEWQMWRLLHPSVCPTNEFTLLYSLTNFFQNFGLDTTIFIVPGESFPMPHCLTALYPPPSPSPTTSIPHATLSCALRSHSLSMRISCLLSFTISLVRPDPTTGHSYMTCTSHRMIRTQSSPCCLTQHFLHISNIFSSHSILTW